MNILHDTQQSVELPSFATSLCIDGVDVHVRCFYVNQPKPHYQLLTCSDQSAPGIIDIPADHEVDLVQQIEEAAVCFATAVRLRCQYST